MATTHENEVAARVTSDELLHASINTILFTRSCVIIALAALAMKSPLPYIILFFNYKSLLGNALEEIIFVFI
jgi:uncharacterized membrane protein